MWQNEERCTVGETVFQILPERLFEGEAGMSMEGADFWLFKERPLVERYVELVEELRPRHIFELGIFQGGSTAFLFELARPVVLVAIDQRPPRGDAMANYLSGMNVGPALRIYDDVDQADRLRLAQIAEEAFGDGPLDFVIDDCSHLYEPSKNSFNELFPRLRSGGVYVIEDWRWAHGLLDGEEPGVLYPDEVPLSRLLFEILLAFPSVPGLVSEVTTRLGAVEVRRGDVEIDPHGFDISACLTQRSRRMLAH
jgi:SAM-dependent methyltransferase